MLMTQSHHFGEDQSHILEIMCATKNINLRIMSARIRGIEEMRDDGEK